jgi:hypothetical protein
MTNGRSMQPERDLLSVLVGSPLSSFEFVQDYLRLRFDGPCLTAYTNPVLHCGDTLLTWDDQGYCNALRSLITHAVSSVDVRYEDAIEVVFDNGVALTISLAPDDYTTAEAALFQSEDRWWVLWGVPYAIAYLAGRSRLDGSVD